MANCFQLGTGYRVTIGGVGTDHHDGIGVLQVDDAVGGSTCTTKRTLHTECSRRVANPGTTVDVVGTDDRTNEFLHQIILFIRTAGRRDTGDAVGSVFFLMVVSFLQRSQRLLPRWLPPVHRSF